MAWISALVSAAGRGGGRVGQAAVDLRGLLLSGRLLRRQPAAGPAGEWGHVVVEPRTAWFVEGQAANLYPVTVAYERQGTGEPVVLLHGLGSHRLTWDSVVPLLTEQREIIAMDLPGFGESPDLDPGVPRDLDTAVLWLGSVFAALGVERPHVVGHSLGGLIALRLGQAGLARSVTAIAPAGFWTGMERRYTYAVVSAARQGVRLLPDSALGALVRTAPARAVLTGTLYGRPELCPPEAVVAALRTLRSSAAFKATLEAGRAPGLFSGDIPDVPVTIAWGTRDRLLPPRQADRARAMIPNAHLVALSGCGHVPMLDAPDVVAHTILRATDPRATEPAEEPEPGSSSTEGQ
ncbi:alpha/beta fold hydrolase [Streptomyces ipomoeae]|nr:alpha/beta fold hydrolase [Streptomyces ipomoeae]MDX2694170.1 alpha/beta fold hydrolase [Streptomyces ipomoeae]MDX2821274.1 alpha/beta fold hydrolase [Streptomyces ipomoeae]MDX2840088.1 alpha/beta fold hydrolase [Streptomyces ipomoeae]MDX2873832.1 alpha/beta fold hydrolase [Streptomyces ipomoeae]MDX2936058.1 alpha/beta fold hydrolase [Streptomyces ipomoeae]